MAFNAKSKRYLNRRAIKDLLTTLNGFQKGFWGLQRVPKKLRCYHGIFIKRIVLKGSRDIPENLGSYMGDLNGLQQRHCFSGLQEIFNGFLGGAGLTESSGVSGVFQKLSGDIQRRSSAFETFQVVSGML